MVIFGHIWGTKNFPLTGDDQLYVGNLGVRFFFIISGFLITGILLKELAKTDTIDLKKFYFRRTLRIFPAYYFFLLIAGLLSFGGLLNIKAWEWLSAVSYTTNFAEVTSWDIGHTWSLAVEEQFYLIIPGLLFFAGKRKTLLILCGVILAAPLIRTGTFYAFGGDLRWIGYGFQANADSLATGCLLAFLRVKLHQIDIYKRILNFKFFLVIPALAFALNLLNDRPRIFNLIAITLINLCVALTIDWAVTNHDRLAGRILNLRPLAYIGTLSYSIYLWQQLFFNRHSDAFTASFPANLLFTALCTLASYYLIEKPALGLRETLEPRLLTRKTPKVKLAPIPIR